MAMDYKPKWIKVSIYVVIAVGIIIFTKTVALDAQSANKETITLPLAIPEYKPLLSEKKSVKDSALAAVKKDSMVEVDTEGEPIDIAAVTHEIPQSKADLNNDQKLVVDFVQRASNYIKANGRDIGLVEFNRQDGIFTKESLYIFALDNKGVLLADSYNNNLVGKSQIDLKDKEGKYIVRDMIDLAKAGGGWIQQHVTNPVSKRMECKMTYIQPIEATYFIGSGYYYPTNADGKCQ